MIEFSTDRRDDGTAVVASTGRLDMVAAPQLRSLVADTVAGGNPRVVVDLSGTSFIDSSGLGALIAGLKTARQAGGDLRIAGAGEQVRMVLELTQLHTVLRPYDSVEAALRVQ
ncbi:MAG: anti-sigma factor antagonist, possible RsbV [Frankiales bacterium]|nr:anti-sigma factor antagonist, possible RsbV [Frankiales bacterium]